MDPERSDDLTAAAHSERWLEYYAEASRRRRARGWHRRRHLRHRIPRRRRTALIMGTLLVLAALATLLALVIPR